MLHEIIGDRIEFLESVNNWEESIKQSTRLLLDQNYCSKNYIDSIIENVHKFGSYFILTDGVAMPHARPEEGVSKLGMSFLKIEKGVFFPNTTDPVTVFFTLCATDNDTHIEAMMELADILGDEEVLDQLKNIQTKEELLKIIS